MAQEAVGSSPIIHPSKYHYLPLKQNSASGVFYNYTKYPMNFPTEINQSVISQLLFPKRDSFKAENSKALPIPNCPIQGNLYANDKEAPVIILFSATDVDLSRLDELLEGAASQNINMLLLSSRTWDEENQDPITIQRYTDEGPELFDAATALLREHDLQGPVFIAGHGLGTLPAMKTMQEREEKLKGIILEGVICDIAKLLSSKGNEEITIDNNAYFSVLKQAIENISKPTLIFHGAGDPISSVPQAENLQSHSGAKTKQYFVIPRAGNPCEGPLCHGVSEIYFRTMRTFIDSVCGLNTWRQRRQRPKTQK